LGYRFE
jgi:hypothetical protein